MLVDGGSVSMPSAMGPEMHEEIEGGQRHKVYGNTIPPVSQGDHLCQVDIRPEENKGG